MHQEPRIEKGIPTPVGRHVAYRWGVLDRMEVGDSVLFTVVDPYVVYLAMRYRHDKRGKKFVSRKAGNSVRVWRIR